MGEDQFKDEATVGPIRLSDLGIPHLRLVLTEIFQEPPPELFPELGEPTSVADLARRRQKPVLTIWKELMDLKNQAIGIEITPEDLASALKSPVKPWLVDVREPWEFALARLPDSILLADVSFPELLAKLRTAPEVVTICHHGVRSFSAAMALREQGVLHCQSLKGGLDLWSRRVDPTIPQY